MVRRTLFLIVIVFFLFPMTSCGFTQTKFTAIDNGDTVFVKVGNQFVVALDGNPSTGYTWEVEDLDTNIIQQVGKTSFKSNNTGLVGAGGTLTLTFRVLKAGTTNLVLVYHRPWETNVQPASTFRITLNAK